MIDYIVPVNASEALSKDSGKDVVIRRVYAIERLHEYRYTFDLLVDDFPKLLYVDLAINRAMEGTTVWQEIYNDLLKQIKELPMRKEEDK